MSCPAASTTHCAGSLVLRTATSVKIAGLRVVLQIGSARYDVAPGASKTLNVKVATGARRLADASGQLKVIAVASTGPSGRIAVSTQGTATKRK